MLDLIETIISIIACILLAILGFIGFLTIIIIASPFIIISIIAGIIVFLIDKLIEFFKKYNINKE